MFRTRTLSLLLVLVLAACGGGDSSPTGPGGGGGGGSGQPIVTANGTMSATINGVFWSANFIIPPGPPPNRPPGPDESALRAIGSGSMSGTSIAFAWFDLDVPFTYTIGAQNSIGFNSVIAHAGGSYTASEHLAGSSGTLTVSTYTANRITGTFQFDVLPAQGQPGGALQIRNGQFDITF